MEQSHDWNLLSCTFIFKIFVSQDC
uniref:Uncharacterized protein n=1 Tax=Rhizophora mucronata TaxID=61149 RepID=A0A2P2PPY8_RHIMU